jgi:hypothetical protein
MTSTTSGRRGHPGNPLLNDPRAISAGRPIYAEELPVALFGKLCRHQGGVEPGCKPRVVHTGGAHREADPACGGRNRRIPPEHLDAGLAAESVGDLLEHLAEKRKARFKRDAEGCEIRLHVSCRESDNDPARVSRIKPSRLFDDTSGRPQRQDHRDRTNPAS